MKKAKFGLGFIPLLFFFAFTGCEKTPNHFGKTPLVSVGEDYLYVEDLNTVVPLNLSKEDSTDFAQKYIHNWICDMLLLRQAETNVSNNDNIAKLVENYRRSLILNIYQQILIEQRLSNAIPDAEIDTFYQANKALFLLEEPLVKGLFIKVPLNAPDLKKVKKWYKSKKEEDLEAIEKYSLKDAILYDYFYDRWLRLSDVASRLPLTREEIEKRLVTNRQIEVSDTAFWYFLNIDSLLNVGNNKPIDFAKREITNILINMKQVDFMKQVKDDLYSSAEEENQIKYY